MFDDHGPRLTDEEIHQYIEDGRFFLACQLMHSGKNAEAVEEFGKLNKAEASYHQAEVSVRQGHDKTIDLNNNVC